MSCTNSDSREEIWNCMWLMCYTPKWVLTFEDMLTYLKCPPVWKEVLKSLVSWNILSVINLKLCILTCSFSCHILVIAVILTRMCLSQLIESIVCIYQVYSFPMNTFRYTTRKKWTCKIVLEYINDLIIVSLIWNINIIVAVSTVN